MYEKNLGEIERSTVDVRRRRRRRRRRIYFGVYICGGVYSCNSDDASLVE